MEDRKKVLKKIFNEVEENQRDLIERLVEEVLYLENKLDELKKLPHIRVHSKNKERQEITPAGKLYKDVTAQYMNAIRILSSILSKVPADDVDLVAEFLKQVKNE